MWRRRAAALLLSQFSARAQPEGPTGCVLVTSRFLPKASTPVSGYPLQSQVRVATTS